MQQLMGVCEALYLIFKRLGWLREYFLEGLAEVLRIFRGHAYHQLAVAASAASEFGRTSSGGVSIIHATSSTVRSA